ncbi:hypothetical protein BKA67DRAFT_27426 [Truncatella angustata]|uniref:Uncharacterized protein n=1 Tax=Truncatella angustata TaxID=152316 RepID=A0A9P8UV42_9PEZI|nr:uncharacterized protein BKA67DRAFT_27426 [Truncatella angustata]KAH6659754.1 hypothetical protein BKA67DRAFT_27426 [Truncatella angustata]KAH8203095.1 hypothetical protein TruAng_002728 [Truncatella angustata]
MTSKSSHAATATSAMSNLSIDSSRPKAESSKAKKVVVADSWEDESSSEEDDDEGTSTPTNKTTTSSSASGFTAPPPTPASPTYSSGAPWQSMTAPDSPEATEKKRPEKTDAVARRMIASALGVKAPKLTEEQRAYDRALREKERKKREEEKDQERKRKEEAERAKVAIWED